ncbi:MAG: hypothetical protein ACPKM0_12950 [Pleomorphochaeta sp.]
MKKKILLFSILLATFMFISCNSQAQFTEMTLVNNSDVEIDTISLFGGMAGEKDTLTKYNILKDGETIGIDESVVYYLPVLVEGTNLIFYISGGTQMEEELEISYENYSKFTLTYKGTNSFTIDGAEIIESNT